MRSMNHNTDMKYYNVFKKYSDKYQKEPKTRTMLRYIINVRLKQYWTII